MCKFHPLQSPFDCILNVKAISEKRSANTYPSLYIRKIDKSSAKSSRPASVVHRMETAIWLELLAMRGNDASEGVDVEMIVKKRRVSHAKMEMCARKNKYTNRQRRRASLHSPCNPRWALICQRTRKSRVQCEASRRRFFSFVAPHG